MSVSQHGFANFHGPLKTLWPWPLPLPNTYLVATCFDLQAFSDEAFQHYGIDMPENLQPAVNKRRAEFLAGRLCARHALEQLDGREAIPGTGKDRAPQWPEGCVGSITHSNGLAAALVSHRSAFIGLGLDIERQLNSAEAQTLVQQILTPMERIRLEHLPPDRRGLAVTLTFSLKESLFKALYPLVGKFFYFEHAELVEWDDRGQARMRLLRDLSHEWPAGRELEAQFCHFHGQLLSLVAITATSSTSPTG